MKGLQVVTALGGAALITLGAVMTVTNPGQDAYEAYAADQLSVYLKNNVCTQAPKSFEGFLKRQCSTLVESGRPQIQQLIAQSTERQNFFLFSIYRTDLSISPVFPAYHFETLGAFQNFFIYQAEKQ